MANRFLFSGGGTGGGVYPALAVMHALQARRPDAEVLWLASASGPERALVEREGVRFVGVPAGPLVGMGLRAIPNVLRLLVGTLRAWSVIRRFRPTACLITGGWATIPAALACWLRRVPLVIFLPDVEPGGTIKALARLAAQVAVVTEDSLAYFPRRTATVTGYPLRADLLWAAGYDVLGQPLPMPPASRAEAQHRFALRPDLPTLLVFGGSTGARSINRAVCAQLEDLLGPAEAPHCQIIHISGRLDAAWVREQAAHLPADLADRYHSFEYLHGEEMALALVAADLAVARAGASVLGEFPLFGLPAILVPYPHAWRYQKVNADYLEARGAAMRLDDDQLTERLVPLVLQLLRDTALRQRMAANAAALRRPEAAARIAALLLDQTPATGG